MQEVTSPYSKILENDVCTSLEILLSVGWCSILLEGEKLTFEAFLHLFKRLNQTIINVEVCVDLNHLFHKNQRWLPRIGDIYPYHEWKQLLSAVDCSQGLINDCWRFCYLSFWLWTEASNVKSFSSEKKFLALPCHP